MLAYGWANTVPAAPRQHPAPEPSPALAGPVPPGGDLQVVTLPTNPGRRHRPVAGE
jgi:paraquat-inducible protein A